MGSIFSGTNNTTTLLDTSNFASKDFVSSQLNSYVKITDIPTQVSAQITSQLPTQLTNQLTNYAKYSDDKKSLKLNINSDTDYFTLNDINNKSIAKFGKNSIIDNIQSKQLTVDNNNLTAGIVLKNQNGGQTNIFAIQNGNDYGQNIGQTDYLRIGKVSVNQDGSLNTNVQFPFIRMDMNPNDTDGKSLNTRIRSNVILNKDINIGEDNYYYNISRDSDMCLTLKYKVKDKDDILIGKWCPDSRVKVP